MWMVVNMIEEFFLVGKYVSMLCFASKMISY